MTVWALSQHWPEEQVWGVQTSAGTAAGAGAAPARQQSGRPGYKALLPPAAAWSPPGSGSGSG